MGALVLGCIVVVVFLVRWVMSRNRRDNRPDGANGESTLDRRIVTLDGELTEETAKWVIAKLLFLQHNEPAPPIHLWVDSEGGNVLAGLAIIDTIKGLRTPV